MLRGSFQPCSTLDRNIAPSRGILFRYTLGFGAIHTPSRSVEHDRNDLLSSRVADIRVVND